MREWCNMKVGIFTLAVLVTVSISAFQRAFAQTNAASTPNAPGPPAAVQAAPAAPNATGTPPPSAPAQRSDADLDKLVAPIALYPDPLIATVLPASAYPLEIVQAARFVQDTNNISKLDTQKWDDNVKAVARFPEVIKQMNDNIEWTSDLGDAFINQAKGVTDAVQRMRAKAQESGALKTTPQQNVTVTNMIVTNTVAETTVYVTNEVVQIQPSQPEVIYVPQYNPTVVYAGYPVSYPGYAYPPAPYYPLAATAVTFGLGMATGAILANNCDWGHGGCWGGGGNYHSDVDINRNVNVNNNVNRNNVNNVNRGQNGNQQKWQPSQNRLKNSGSTASSAQSREARGYPTAANRSTPQSREATQSALNSRSGTTGGGNAAQNRPASGAAGGGNVAQNRPASGAAGGGNVAQNRPASGAAGGGNAAQNRPASGAAGGGNVAQNRPASGASGSQGSVPRNTGGSGASAGSGSGGGRASGGGSSAFNSGGSRAQAQQSSSRGSASRGGGGGARGGGGGRR